MSLYFDAKSLGLDPNERPNMQLINTHVTNKYAVYWENIGENLRIPYLQNIRHDKQGHVSFNKECLKEMLRKWLQIDVNATWEKLEKAINQTISIVFGTLETVGSSEDSSIQIEPEGHDMSRPKGGKRKHDEDEDNPRPTSSMSVNPAKTTTGRGRQEDHIESTTSAKRVKQDPDDEIDGTDQVDIGNQADFIPKHSSGYDEKDIEMKPNQGDGVPSKSTSTEPSTAAVSNAGPEMADYPKISKKLPAYAVIINNKEFDTGKREGTDQDEKSIKKLKSLNVSVKHVLKDLTADEMVGALKFLATKDPDKLSSVGNGRGALKLMNTTEEKINKFNTIEKIRGGLMLCMDDLKSFEGYSCLMVFIMTHGSNNGILAGRDSSQTTVDELAEVFNSEQCKELEGRPKIFIIQACRGGDVDEMRADDDKSDDDKDDQVSCAVPKEADFLYVYATPKGYKALRHPSKGSPFIQTLVEVLLQTREHKCHLEEALLSVKHKVAKDNFKHKSKPVKMMPSVVSQMRGRIEFDLNTA